MCAIKPCRKRQPGLDCSVSRRRKQKSLKAGSTVPASPSTTPTTHPGGTRILHDFVIGVLFTLVLLGLKALFELTPPGEQLDLAGYNLAQRLLGVGRSDVELPVVVLDISDIQPLPIPGSNGKETATPRDELQNLIARIVQRSPKAIGIDIDFSLDEHGMPITPADPKFFQFCLDQLPQHGVPVFLGVDRQQTQPPEDWFGDLVFSRLGVNLNIPSGPKQKLAGSIRIGAKGAQLHSMSEALAVAYNNAIGGVPWGFNWAVESYSEKKLGKDVYFGLFPADFSQLKRFRDKVLEPKDFLVGTERAKIANGKMVLLGDATWEQAPDKFSVSTEPESVPGVFLHASAAYTLASAPLREFRWQGRVAIDLLFSLAVIGGLACIRLHYRSRTERSVATHRVQGGLTFLVVLLMIVIGFCMIRFWRILWTDFFLVFAALVAHPSVERYTMFLGRWMRGSIPDAWYRFIFEAGKEEAS